MARIKVHFISEIQPGMRVYNKLIKQEMLVSCTAAGIPICVLAIGILHPHEWEIIEDEKSKEDDLDEREGRVKSESEYQDDLPF